MEINVNVTIGLAQHVQDLAQALIESITRPAEVPEHYAVSNEIPTVAVASTPKGVSKPQPKQEVEPTDEEADHAQEHPQEQCATVSIEQVRDRVAELIPKGFRAKIQEILQGYGVTGYGQLKGDDLVEFYQKIKEL